MELFSYIMVDFVTKNGRILLYTFAFFVLICRHLAYGLIANLIILVLLNAAKVKQKVVVKRFLECERPTLIIAQRCAGQDAPENTLRAARIAKQNGADGVKIDVTFTYDDVPVVIHDNTVDRTTDGEGPVDELTFEELCELSIVDKNYDDSELIYEKIPRLEEMVELCLDLKLKMIIDIKDPSRIDRTVTTFNSLYEKFPKLYTMATLSSYYPQLKYSNKDFVTGSIHREQCLCLHFDGTPKELQWYYTMIFYPLDTVLDWLHNNILWYICQNQVFITDYRVSSRRTIQLMKDRGLEVIVFTVNNYHAQRYFKHTLEISYMTDTMNYDGS